MFVELYFCPTSNTAGITVKLIGDAIRQVVSLSNRGCAHGFGYDAILQLSSNILKIITKKL